MARFCYVNGLLLLCKWLDFAIENNRKQQKTTKNVCMLLLLLEDREGYPPSENCYVIMLLGACRVGGVQWLLFLQGGGLPAIQTIRYGTYGLTGLYGVYVVNGRRRGTQLTNFLIARTCILVYEHRAHVFTCKSRFRVFFLRPRSFRRPRSFLRSLSIACAGKKRNLKKTPKCARKIENMKKVQKSFKKSKKLKN